MERIKEKYTFPSACLNIFAKAPVPGQVKTRLIRAIGKNNAAVLHAAMLENITTKMLHSKICPIQIHCYPDIDHPIFNRLHRAGAALRQQVGADLGARMYYGMNTNLEKYDYVVLIGCDCPSITDTIIKQTIDRLKNTAADVVIGPAVDGGYYLIGAKRVEKNWFENIRWGSSGVCEQTRSIFYQAGVNWSELETFRDIDTFDDLKTFNRQNRKLSQKIKQLSIEIRNTVTPNL